MVAIPASLLQLLTESGLPIVYVVCDNWPVYTASTDPWIARFEGGGPLRALAGRAVQRVSGMPTTRGRFTDRGSFCFVSDTTRAAVIDAKPWSYPRSTVVYSGIEPADFPTESSSDENPERVVGRLLYVGRLDALKGVDTLLRALTLLPPEVTLECFGRGADHERARLRALAQSLGVATRVEFGSLERNELAARYRAADAVVFPSEWPEPFGLVPLEAMACGTPVVASGVGGSGEFLRDGENCVRFKPRDEHALAGAITRLLRDPDLRRLVVKGGFETARELTVDHLADTLDDWHRAAISGDSGRDRGRDLAAAGVIRIPPRGPVDDRDRVVAALLNRSHGPVLDLTTDDRTVRAAGAIVRADAHALPFRDHAFAAAAAHDTQGSKELARVVRAGGSVVFSTTNRFDARLASRRVLERVRLGPDRARTRHAVDALDAHFDVVGRHPVAWTGGRKRALAARVVRLGPLRRFGPATVLETKPRQPLMPIRPV
jgi:glycosyltransferase involved in cell wall biosynthesis